MPNLADFLHGLRAEIITLLGRENVILNFTCDELTAPGTLSLNVVIVGDSIIPFVFEPGDFDDYENARRYILETLPKYAGLKTGEKP